MAKINTHKSLILLIILIKNSIGFRQSKNQRTTNFIEYDGRSIYWNKTDPIFNSRESTLKIKLGDTLDILCPSEKLARSVEEPVDVFEIYMVDPRSFKNCYNKRRDASVDSSIPESTTRRQTNFQKSKSTLIYKCNRPESIKKLTLNIFEVSPFMNAVLFYPGRNYYFISGDEKLCKEGMKLKIRVTEGKLKK